MREIKFRAWDKELKYMHRGSNFLSVSWNKEGYLHHSELIFLQYTGLKDDNEVEVYDGDIIVDIEGTKLLVEWNDDTCKFQFSDGSDINDNNRYGTYKIIIGNIYENPELLK